MKTLLNVSFLLISYFSYTQSTIYNSGAGNFTVPCGVTSITVQIWGGGGAGGGDGTNDSNGGSGGGAGGYSTATIAVTPGQVIAYSVGAGGAANSGNNAGGNGGNTTFGALTANGGKGGSPNGANAGTAGDGGTASGGTTNTSGADGVDRTLNGNTGGAGGNAAGGGGTGGAGGADAADGTDGNAPGGGGGGAGDKGTGILAGNRSGGAGGAGRVSITYAAPIVLTSDAGTNQTLAACATTGTLAAVAPVNGTGTWTCVTNCAGVNIANPTSPTSTFSGLIVPNATTFRWTVSNTGCTSATDDVIISTTSGPMCPVYCAKGTMNCASFGDGLVNVSFGTINAASATCANGSAACAIVTAGNTYAFSATSGPSTGNHSLAVYCDWNSNGSFADAGEFTLVANNNMIQNSTRSTNITVPAGAACGATIKMRVVYVYSTPVPTAANGCSNFTYGETEDYCLTISCCTPNCANGIQDCNELGVDCGGPCGSACPGVATCQDAIQNQDEIGLDCGGLVCAPCGTPCATFSGMTSTPASGSIIDASVSNQTIDACVEVTYSNRGTNWLHGVFVNPATTGFVSSTGINGPPEPNISAGAPPATYKWSNQTANFTGQTSGNSVNQDGWFVETGTVNTNPGNNLGWPTGAGVTLGPFCFRTTLSCNGLEGDVAGSLSFQTTGDSYSGSWTTVDCGKETSFGDNVVNYTLRCPVALPIELLSFNAKYDGRHVKVFWSTQTEVENDHFEVYKSNDGVKFEKLGENINGAPGGYSNEQRNYELIDHHPSSEMTYYKLRQYDFNGEFKESKIIGIISPMTLKEIAVIPNPVKEIATIIFKTNDEFSTKIKVYDVSGKEQFTSTIDTQYGINSFSFSTDQLSNGIYFIDISNEMEIQKIKFIKEN